MTSDLLPFALLGVLALAALLLPVLLRRVSGQPSRAERSLAVLRDKLVQIERDREAGILGAEEAKGAEAEIGRAIIAASREADEEAARGAGASGGKAMVAITAVAAFGIAVLLYAQVGSLGRLDTIADGGRDMTAAGEPTLASDHEGSMVSDAIVSLRQRLEINPQNADNWHLLARSYSTTGAYDKAAEAYRQLIELVPLDINIRGDYAETLVRAEKGLVVPEAVKAFEVVLAHAPNDPRASYYMALRDAQEGNSMAAAERWASILRTAPPEAPYRPAIRQILDQIIEDAELDRAALDIPEPVAPAAPAPGPTAEDVAAASQMPAGDQMEMIRGMVARLEARLAEEPEDVDGWLRLARSKAVLGEPEEAVSALETALEANPGNEALSAAIAELRGAGTR